MCPSDGGVRVVDVAAVRGLAGRAGRNQPVPPRTAERDRCQEAGHGRATLVLQRQRRHPQPRVVGEQGDDRVDVAALERLGEAGGKVAFAAGVGEHGAAHG